ncbi:MAG: AAA family ATPase [Verrucomicrobiota bacterium]
MRQEIDALRQRLNSTVLGAEDASEMLLIALLAKGHALIEGAPGIGKTSLAQTLAQSVSASFKRIQFTPDLLPSDILGYSIYNQQSSEFEFVAGPIFSQFILADEINRTSPRIQSALLECMNEGQASVDGVTRSLGDPFMVIATQNNLYATGTFPLPEPQLDRFLVSIQMALPPPEVQAGILLHHAEAGTKSSGVKAAPILSAEQILDMQEAVREVRAHEKICVYITKLCEAVRRQKGTGTVVSSRASIAILRAAQAAAFLSGQEAVYPDDIKKVFPAALRHRLSGADLRESTPVSPGTVIEEALRSTPVP